MGTENDVPNLIPRSLLRDPKWFQEHSAAVMKAAGEGRIVADPVPDAPAPKYDTPFPESPEAEARDIAKRYQRLRNMGYDVPLGEPEPRLIVRPTEAPYVKRSDLRDRRFYEEHAAEIEAAISAGHIIDDHPTSPRGRR